MNVELRTQAISLWKEISSTPDDNLLNLESSCICAENALTIRIPIKFSSMKLVRADNRSCCLSQRYLN